MGLFIGMLVVYEAIVGALVVSEGHRAQLGYVGVIGFYLALALFGWFLTVWALVMVPPMVLLLLRAEQRASLATITTPMDRPMTVGAARYS